MASSKLRPLAAFAALVLISSGCASTRKTVPELSRLEGKKVALIELEAEATARSIVEVALVNQLMKRGTFVLVSKTDVEAARQSTAVDPTDYKKIAQLAGGDFALRAKVLKFDAIEREGYENEVVEDSQLKAERGEKGSKVSRPYKVKSLTGDVQVELEFTDLAEPDDVRRGTAEASNVVSKDARKEAIRMPPKMRFLEDLANEAFRQFFEKYN